MWWTLDLYHHFLLIATLCCYRKRSERTGTSCIRINQHNPLETTHVLSSDNSPSLYLSWCSWGIELPENLTPTCQFSCSEKYLLPDCLQNRTECDFRPFVYTLYLDSGKVSLYFLLRWQIIPPYHLSHFNPLNFLSENHAAISFSLQFVSRIINSLSTLENPFPVPRMRENDLLFLLQP